MKHFHEVQHFNIPLNLNYVDKMPYIHNRELCPKDTISLNSGNMIKHYTVEMSEDTFNTETMDFDPNIIESTAKVIKSEPIKEAAPIVQEEASTSDDNMDSKDNMESNEDLNEIYEEQADDYYSEEDSHDGY